jgi:deoxyribodipyrimidine photo-lyase
MKTSSPICVHWFRRDLRIEDNAALCMALQSGYPVLCLFIFDKNILDRLEDKRDARVTFLHHRLASLREQIASAGGSLRVEYGTPQEVWKKLMQEHTLHTVFANRDYEPYALQRDKAIFELLKASGVDFKGAKDHVVFEKSEVVKDDGKPYTVFTPYSRKWKQRLTPDHYKPYPTEKYLAALGNIPVAAMPTLEDMGFEESSIVFPDAIADVRIIEQYEKNRDIPSIRGTTRLSLHLRFGTVSIRSLVRLALTSSEKWLNELIWRDFYQMILFQSNRYTIAFHGATTGKSLKNGAQDAPVIPW